MRMPTEAGYYWVRLEHVKDKLEYHLARWLPSHEHFVLINPITAGWIQKPSAINTWCKCLTPMEMFHQGVLFTRDNSCPHELEEADQVAADRAPIGDDDSGIMLF